MHPRYIVSRRLRRQYQLAAERVSRPRWQGADRAARQLTALQQVWADATADVPYYQRLVRAGQAPARIETWSDVRQIPVLTRQILQDSRDDFVRRSAAPDSIMKTAGSTGTPIHVGMDQSERDLMRTVKLSAWQELGYGPDDRLFIMWGHVHLLGSGLTRALNQARRTMADALLGYKRVNAYRLNPQICGMFAEELIAFRPTGFISYASALDLFARYTQGYKDRFRALGLKFVLATSEPPPRPDTTSLIRDLFGCPVVQEYGGSEFGQVAFKCDDEPFDVYPDLNYVEVEPAPEGAPSPLLISSLYRRYLPLIRYRVGDAVSLPVVDEIGHTTAFASVAGRLNDVVVLQGGDAIHSLSIFHALHDETGIYNAQMVLRDDAIEIRLVAPHVDRAAAVERLRPRLARIHPVLGATQFTFVDDVGTTRAGKRRWFVDQRTTPPCAASPAS